MPRDVRRGHAEVPRGVLSGSLQDEGDVAAPERRINRLDGLLIRLAHVRCLRLPGIRARASDGEVDNLQPTDARIPLVLNWDDLRHVLAVEQAGSLVAAARALKVDKATVSRRVAAAE